VGSAASATQLVPEVAREAAELIVLQRSPNYHFPRGDYAFPRWLLTLFTWLPFLATLYHWFCFTFYGEFLMLAVIQQRPLALLIAKVALLPRSLQCCLRSLTLRHQVLFWLSLRKVKDPTVREKLRPNYAIGAKRVIFSDEYLPTFNRPNVRLVTEAIERIEPRGIRCSGTFIEADVIVYATGFKSTEFLAPLKISGRGGKVLHDEWAGTAKAYLGTTVRPLERAFPHYVFNPTSQVTGFPNLFILYGPNTNLGHNSILKIIEADVRSAVRSVVSLSRSEDVLLHRCIIFSIWWTR